MSDNLSLSQITASQNQKEVTANDKGGELDAAITEITTIAVDNTNAYTLSNSELQRGNLINVTDDASVPTATITLTVPAIKRGIFAITNSSSYEVNASISGQAQPVVNIPTAGFALVHSDGSDVRPTSSASGLTSVRVTMFAAGNQSDGELLGFFVASEAFNIPSGMAGSYARVKTAPAAATSLDVKKNGSSVGSIDFALGANTATFTMASQTAIAAGDYIEIVAPSPADGSIADLTVNIKGSV